jgi:hypothetical protein
MAAVKWKRDLDRCPFALGASYGNRAAERFDAVAQADEPGASRRIGASQAAKVVRRFRGSRLRQD